MIETIQHGSLKWQHITNPTEKDYAFLMDTYHFHPLDIEDCHETNHRPKIDEYDDYYFLILHFPYFDKAKKFVRISEVKLFWGKDFVITIGKAHWVIDKLFDETQEDYSDRDEDTLEFLSCSDLLLYNILDRLMKETYTLILTVGSNLDMINYNIFNKKAKPVIEDISINRSNIIQLNTTFRPQLRVLHMFESGGIKGFVSPEIVEMDDYWGDILDQYQKMFDMVEDYGELIEGQSKTFDSLQANKTNEIMKVLTVFNTIMLPLTVITGFLGMNIDFPFPTGATSMWVILVSMIVITIALIFYFNRQTDR
ncbi:MAG: magnesium transporter CorA family protein [Bacteroidales bacterium]|nr:magnesium transporter CorA family protein [Bacteroidales bacterium]